MLHVSTPSDPLILAQDERPAAEVVNPGGRAPICLVCEHASAAIPASLDGLGLAPEGRFSHAAWDIGARSLAVMLSRLLDAPLVASRVSRLVYDCNRPPEAPDAIPERSEVIEIPGNRSLSHQDKARRVEEVYLPFKKCLSETLDGFATPPALVTVHSFTPVWHGRRRDVELGLLHDADDRLARAALDVAPATLDTRLNAPYSASDGVTHTLREHALPRGLPNVMLEIRNDLISDDTGVARIADLLAAMLSRALENGATA